MVYLREILINNKVQLFENRNIELAAYLYLQSSTELAYHSFELSPEEEMALSGYMQKQMNVETIMSIIAKSPVKGIDATSNVYKFCGLYLSAKENLRMKLNEKFQKSNWLQKYFLSKIEPDIKERLLDELPSEDYEPSVSIIRCILDSERQCTSELDDALKKLITGSIDVQTQILLEDFQQELLKIRFVNQTADDVVRSVMGNFSNSVKKITQGRRKGHQLFEIKDEYDVQDILYVILKSIFPTLRDEDPIAKVGDSSTKIDLIIREEDILIEVKMIKESDTNENKFIEQLKVDIESYHECKWLRRLFCFVWDPGKKTKDTFNFTSLNGQREKNGNRFEVEVIVAS